MEHGPYTLKREEPINLRADVYDLETICTDPTYKAYIPEVAHHPTCWPELRQWVWQYVADPLSAGVPPMPPEKASKSKHSAHLRGMGVRSSRRRVPKILATIFGQNRKRMFLLSLAILAVLVAIVSLPHSKPTFSQKNADPVAASTGNTENDVLLGKAKKTAERARESPAYDAQLAKSLQQLQEDIDSQDFQQVASDIHTVQDLQQQKENVKIGEVTAELTGSIEAIGQYNDVQDIPEHKKMMAIADRWSGESIDGSDLSQAISDSSSLQQLLKKCDLVQKEREEQANRKKMEEQQRSQQDSATDQPMTTSQRVPQTSPQPTLRQQEQQQSTQSGQNYEEGTDGVTIG